MQLSPTYRALLRVIPDLSWVYRFIPQLGRGRCPWIHGLTKTGAKISRFLKKGLIKTHVWVSNSEIVSVERDRIYQVSQDECTCPEWKHRISQNKGYRHIPDLFKGYVSVCKHQVQQWLRSHDVSKFSEFIHTIDPQEEKLNEVIEHSLPEGIKLCRQEGDMGIEYRFAVIFSPPTKERKKLGDLSIGVYGELSFKVSKSIFWKKFPTLIDGIDYLMKSCSQKYSEVIKPRHSIESLLNSTVPEGISISKSIDSDGYFWGLGIRFSYWEPPKTEYGEYKKERRGLGLIKICQQPHAHANVGDLEVFLSWKDWLGKGFNNLDDAINYLLKYHRLTLEMAYEPDEIKAINDLFGAAPEYPIQEYFEEEKPLESKPTKKWFSLSNLQNQEMPF